MLGYTIEECDDYSLFTSLGSAAVAAAGDDTGNYDYVPLASPSPRPLPPPAPSRPHPFTALSSTQVVYFQQQCPGAGYAGLAWVPGTVSIINQISYYPLSWIVEVLLHELVRTKDLEPWTWNRWRLWEPYLRLLAKAPRDRVTTSARIMPATSQTAGSARRHGATPT